MSLNEIAAIALRSLAVTGAALYGGDVARAMRAGLTGADATDDRVAREASAGIEALEAYLGG